MLANGGVAPARQEDIIEIKRPRAASPLVELKKPAGELAQVVAVRKAFLTQYQDAAYAKLYTDLVDKVAHAEREATGTSRLALAVARYYFKLMAYKDEYEVARLYSDGAFIKRVGEQFEGDWKLRFHLAPPMFARRDKDGHLIKRSYGPGMLRVFGLLARLRFLRGTRLDLFGYTKERRAERELMREYRETMTAILSKLNRGNLDRAVALASVPEEIRGYGHVKEASMARAEEVREELLKEFSARVVAIGVRAA
ncbi:indolepyruvate ferredoxin oxidoreductase [compost metagenome]